MVCDVLFVVMWGFVCLLLCCWFVLVCCANCVLVWGCVFALSCFFCCGLVRCVSVCLCVLFEFVFVGVAVVFDVLCCLCGLCL